MGHSWVWASNRNNSQTAFCTVMNVLRQSEASRARQLWRGGSSSKAEAGNRLPACWCPAFCCGAAGRSVWGRCQSLAPFLVWSGDLGCSLESSHGKGWSCELLKGCLAIAKPTRYSEKREDRGTRWAGTSVQSRSSGMGLAPGSSGVMGHRGTALPSPALHSPLGSLHPTGQLDPRWLCPPHRQP